MKSIISNLITGGAGFLGSHLLESLLNEGEKVICLDNFLTGSEKNISKWITNSNFKLIDHDIIEPIDLEVDKIWHFACPASPAIYKNDPISTAKINFLGTYNMLCLAKKLNAKFLLASSSEIYGEPEIHPQTESYNGSVNCIGERSCYVEGKRIAESLCSDFKRKHKCNVKIARIFNTYGPRMKINDGRVVGNFIVQSLSNKPITIYGNGEQTRSFCFVDDLVNGLKLFMNSNYAGPLNLGNPHELRIIDLAKIVNTRIGNSFNIEYSQLPFGEPSKRKPSIDLAKKHIGWEPYISIDLGIEKTISYFRDELFNSRIIR